MNRSDSIKELASALCKAQAVIEGASKDKKNDHFRSKYADLGNCWDAARKPLTDNGLSVAQFAKSDETGVQVETMLMHISGEYVSETLHIPLAKRDAHGVGAAITYGRRFGLCAVVGISPEDDDGNAAAGHAKVDPTTAPRGSAREVTTDAYNALTQAEQESLRSKFHFLCDTFESKGIVETYNALMDLNLDTEGQLAMSALMDSALRNQLKAEGARRRQNEKKAA